MSKPPAPSDLADKFMLRMPDGMRGRIAEAAKANKRSMNAEIVARLEDSLYAPIEPHTDDAILQAIDDVARRLARLEEFRKRDDELRARDGLDPMPDS